MVTEPERPRRADAVRNRERVLEAAEELFATEGVGVHIEQVAQRAGVGVGTVCRNFPTKESLIEAVLTVMWESLLADARAALHAEDPGMALRGYLARKGSVHTRYLALVRGTAPGTDPPSPAKAVREELRSVFAQLVERAQASGAIRTDVGPQDLVALYSGIAQAIDQVSGEPDDALWERYLTILMDGLRRPTGLEHREV
ncbi:MAG TPA: TetR/AcrR family transcriptional regulator [Actinomycetota bacterium]|nr:TetR/AcrR family transcriptional regulator [Actinomycetota bacterium]